MFTGADTDADDDDHHRRKLMSFSIDMNKVIYYN